MPYSLQWDDPEETIMYLELIGKWTWEEFFKATEHIVEAFNQKPYRCDIICNARTGTMTSVAPVLHNGQQIIRSLPENFGIIVAITDSLTTMLVNTFKRFNPELGEKVVSVTSHWQATNVIIQRRETV